MAAADVEPSTDSDRAPQRVLVSVLVNAVLVPAAIAIWLATKSQLVLAQGADSLLDVVVGAILLYSLRVARRPSDEDHPFGHERAEPLGAIVAAILAGALAIEVLHSGIAALTTGQVALLDTRVAALLAGKLVLKLAFLRWIGKNRDSAAVHAARVDARNDVVACASSLVGFFLTRAGFGWADAALALPVGIYIGFNGIELARENVRYLMGEAPASEVLEGFTRTVRAVPGVLNVTGLRAQHLGQSLQVMVSILVDGSKSATQGHDISVEVQRRLEDHPTVGEAFVHVDTERGVDHP